MTIAETMLPEFDQEMTITRRLLERVPDGKSDWKPHPKSMELGFLAMHIASMPEWGTTTLRLLELNFGDPKTVERYALPPFSTTESLLERFDRLVEEARAALASISDEELQVPWTLRNGDHIMFTLPRIVTFRTWVLNHTIHHRGQLGVYLRLLDVPLPSVYGPSADTP
jgi:uncharacterized damage-inducible protein DinB